MGILARIWNLPRWYVKFKSLKNWYGICKNKKYTENENRKWKLKINYNLKIRIKIENKKREWKSKS